MNASEMEAIFARTLLGDYEAEDAWMAIVALRQHGSREIFEYAAAWCASDDSLKRARAAAILCQLRRAPMTNELPEGSAYVKTETIFCDESYSLITKMLENEQDPMVLDSAIHALGHLYNAAAIPLILTYQNHPDENVRLAVTRALGCFPNDPLYVCGLLKLTSDPDTDVRDWAVFGVGVKGDVDSPEIRDALLRCLDDSSVDVREEAAIGLGRRQDRRLIPKLRKMLHEPVFKKRVAEAAAALLGMDHDPPEWTAEDYKAALQDRFPNSD
jgi:HEAT repeat protein